MIMFPLENTKVEEAKGRRIQGTIYIYPKQNKKF